MSPLAVLRPRAVIFDLDGTLIDSAPDLLDSLNHVLTSLSRRKVDLDEVHAMMGHGAVKLLEQGLSLTGGEPEGTDHEALVKRFLDYYEAHIPARTRLYPGVADTLKALADEGHMLAICTNKMQHFTEKIIDQLDLAGFFQAVIGGGVTGTAKPDPGHLKAVLDQFDCTAGDAVMVGDSRNDSDAAQGLGMAVILVTFGYSREAVETLGADRLIDHFSELPAALADLSRPA